VNVWRSLCWWPSTQQFNTQADGCEEIGKLPRVLSAGEFNNVYASLFRQKQAVKNKQTRKKTKIVRVREMSVELSMKD